MSNESKPPSLLPGWQLYLYTPAFQRGCNLFTHPKWKIALPKISQRFLQPVWTLPKKNYSCHRRTYSVTPKVQKHSNLDPRSKDTLFLWLALSDGCGLRDGKAASLRKINEDVKVTVDTWLVSKPQNWQQGKRWWRKKGSRASCRSCQRNVLLEAQQRRSRMTQRETTE